MIKGYPKIIEQPPLVYEIKTLNLAFFMTARAAFAAIRARLTATVAAATGNNGDFRHIHCLSRLLFLVFLHRAGIFVLTAISAHRAFAVFTAIRHRAARIFLILA